MIPPRGATAGPGAQPDRISRPRLGRQRDRRQLHVLDEGLQPFPNALDMMFGDGESFKDFYLKQSNGHFLAKGDSSPTRV